MLDGPLPFEILQVIMETQVYDSWRFNDQSISKRVEKNRSTHIEFGQMDALEYVFCLYQS